MEKATLKFRTFDGAEFETWAEARASLGPEDVKLACAARVPVISAVETDPAKARDWALVVRCLSYNGDLRARVDAAGLYATAYLLCDGFGTIDLDWAEGQCWDWSHVRDSSDAALARCAAYLRSGLGIED